MIINKLYFNADIFIQIAPHVKIAISGQSPLKKSQRCKNYTAVIVAQDTQQNSIFLPNNPQKALRILQGFLAQLDLFDKAFPCIYGGNKNP